MIDSLITSKTRVKILLRFFLNSQTTGYLRNLETEFDESTNSIRMELNKLEKAGLLKSINEKNKKLFFANTAHPLYSDINNMLKKVIGIDQIIEHIIDKVGDLKAAYLVGKLADGRDSETIELVLTGDKLDQQYISQLIAETKEYIKRKIVCSILTNDELIADYKSKSILLIWKSE